MPSLRTRPLTMALALVLTACPDPAADTDEAPDVYIPRDTGTDTDNDNDTDTDTDSDTDTEPPALRLLVFSKTSGYRHGSIQDGLELLDDMARDEGWTMTATENAASFAAALPETDVVVFLSPTGDVLDASQEAALEGWVRAGGGWVGVHAAADCEYDWPFYGTLVGAWFRSHPHIQNARILVEDATAPATVDLPNPWVRSDEWYSFRSNPRGRVQVLLALDEDSYEGGGMDGDHPIAWQHAIDDGRAFYTALGHTSATYEEPAFRAHLRGAITWVARLP